MKNDFSIILTAVAMVFLTSCDCSPSYSSFNKRDPSYYAELAQACNKLLSEIPENMTNKIVIKSTDDKSLPIIIQNLHSTKIQVGRNLPGLWQGNTIYRSGVSIMVGISRDGYGISWDQNDYGNGNQPWELSV